MRITLAAARAFNVKAPALIGASNELFVAIASSFEGPFPDAERKVRSSRLLTSFCWAQREHAIPGLRRQRQSNFNA
jgi:hypothetical protein